MDADSHARRPILVTGLPRSGTSLVAGSLASCGAFTGRTVGPSDANPKGFFENEFLREEIVKRLLSTLSCDPLGVTRLPDTQSLCPVDGLDRAVLAALSAEGYDGNGPWLFKDAKLSLLWPLWRHAFPRARWVLVRRERSDVIDSCLRTPFMVQHSRERDFWERFIDEYEQRLAALKQSGAWWREIRPHELVTGDLRPLRTLAEQAGLSWRETPVREFVSPRHWHARARAGSAS